MLLTSISVLHSQNQSKNQNLGINRMRRQILKKIKLKTPKYDVQFKISPIFSSPVRA